jgi:transcriptional regulator
VRELRNKDFSNDEIKKILDIMTIKINEEKAECTIESAKKTIDYMSQNFKGKVLERLDN